MSALNKTFILTQFGEPHAWTQQFIDGVQFLQNFSWEWKIFTPNDFKSRGNVEIIPMTIEEFNKLCEKNIGLNPEVEMKNGLPSKPMSDYYVANGLIFKDYLTKSDFWGITNWDVVYGRLDHFIPDYLLADGDIFSDDINAINGVFSLYRNVDEVNNLFRKIEGWEEMFHVARVVGTDELEMTKVVHEVRFLCPQHFPLLSHDRLENHVPNIKLKRESDWSLWELLADTKPVEGLLARPFFGREIPYFHFSRTKAWPNIL